jgi:hypothetical protein
MTAVQLCEQKDLEMHWVIQENLHREPGHDDLIAALRRAGVSHSQHKVVPFTGDIVPDVLPAGPIVVMGTYSLCRLAERKGWMPGCFDVGRVPYALQVSMWGKNLLNGDAVVSAFGDASPDVEVFFIRPTADSKVFAGTVMTAVELRDWQRRVVELGEDDGSGLRASTEVLWALPKEIKDEYRLWVVDGRVVTASRYRPSSTHVPAEAISFGNRMAETWTPLPAFVMDVCRHETEWKIIEINTLNACGFYAADLDRLVAAIEGTKVKGGTTREKTD